MAELPAAPDVKGGQAEVLGKVRVTELVAPAERTLRKAVDEQDFRASGVACVIGGKTHAVGGGDVTADHRVIR